MGEHGSALYPGRFGAGGHGVADVTPLAKKGSTGYSPKVRRSLPGESVLVLKRGSISHALEDLPAAPSIRGLQLFLLLPLLLRGWWWAMWALAPCWVHCAPSAWSCICGSRQLVSCQVLLGKARAGRADGCANPDVLFPEEHGKLLQLQA